jgi:hypothetical protein
MRLSGTLRWIVDQTDDAKEGPRAFAEKNASLVTKAASAP